MKIRSGFVSNSSSTMFVITNTSDKRKTLIDFVLENPHLIENYRAQYDWDKHTQAELLFSAKENNFYIKAKEKKLCRFGDEQGTLIGRVFDYILRDGGKSKSFKWKFHSWLR